MNPKTNERQSVFNKIPNMLLLQVRSKGGYQSRETRRKIYLEKNTCFNKRRDPTDSMRFRGFERIQLRRVNKNNYELFSNGNKRTHNGARAFSRRTRSRRRTVYIYYTDEVDRRIIIIIITINYFLINGK